MALSWQTIFSVDDITQKQWQQLSNHKTEYSSPFLSHVFLKGLESTQCIDHNTGWLSNHIGIFENDDGGGDGGDGGDKTLVAFIPCYLKTHSYGEYVFDHAWANAYQQHQIPYYPKLVVCIPFTPVTGSRMLLNNESSYTFEAITAYLNQQKDLIIEAARASSLHYLFVPEYQSKLLAEENLLERHSVQFVWQNRDYLTFDHFMQQMTSRKRRSIRKERAASIKLTPTQNINIERLWGDALTREVLADFYLCYQQTYLKRSGHTGYLTQAFFEYLQENMRNEVMIVMAYCSEGSEQKCIASALFFYNEEQLFGRYWGALQEVSGLHFECCYYQGIEFAIEKKLRQFNPGTQGEHKILRGFEPTICFSNHYLQHPDFHSAVDDFLKREKIGIEQYQEQAQRVLPFKKA